MNRSDLRNEIRLKFHKSKEKLFYTEPIMIVGPKSAGKQAFIRNVFREVEVKWVDEEDNEILAVALDDKESLTNFIGRYEVIVFINGQKRNFGKLISALRITPPHPLLLILEDSLLYYYTGPMCNEIEGLKLDNIYHFLPESLSDLSVSPSGICNSETKAEELMRFGFYPEVLLNPNNREEFLKELVSNQLLKPVIDYPLIRKGNRVLFLLLVELAKSIGQDVSYNQLQDKVGIDKNTISVFIEYLEESFIIRRMNCYGVGIEGEKQQLQKFYFHDVGVRNALIEDFRPGELRSDSELKYLWENFVLSEMWKKERYLHIPNSSFQFWKLNQTNYVDLICEIDEKRRAFMFSWSKAISPKVYKKFEDKTGLSVEVIDSTNYMSFI